MSETKSKRKTAKREKPEERNYPIVTYSPEQYARDMERVFSDFERRMERALPGFGGGGFLLPRWRMFELPEVRRPFTDLIDSGSEFVIRAEVPGIPKDKLNIEVKPREVRIEGRAESDINEKKEGYVHRERTYSSVRRDIALPEEVVPEKADATVKDGVLEIRLTKKIPSEAKTHKLQVR